jgi:CRISPR-associated endonuclease/helicase Cas3
MTNLLANKNEYACKEENRTYFFRQPFKSAALKFKVFDDNTVDIIVPYKEEGIRLIEKLRKADQNKTSTLRGLSKEILQEIKPYTINIFQYQKNQMEEYGLLEHLFGGRILILNGNAYHDDYGLGIISEQKVESYIF